MKTAEVIAQGHRQERVDHARDGTIPARLKVHVHDPVLASGVGGGLIGTHLMTGQSIPTRGWAGRLAPKAAATHRRNQRRQPAVLSPH